jgi:hypothetical protein
MQDVVIELRGVVLYGFHDHSGDGWLPKIQRTGMGFIQQAVHGGKCLSRIDICRRERPVRRQAVVQTPGEEDGLVRLMIVRKPAAVEGHTGEFGETGDFLRKVEADRGVGRGRGRPPHLSS